jgi:hypothetical protein
MGAHKTRDIVDMTVGVVANDALAQPDDLLDAQ